MHAHRLGGVAEALERLQEERGKRREAGRRTADDGEHEREPVASGANDRFGVPADADPCGNRPVGVGYDILLEQRRARLALPRDGSALDQGREEVGLLLEEVLVVGQVVTEQRERLGARSAAENDFSPAAGNGVEGGVSLEHPDGVVRAENCHR